MRESLQRISDERIINVVDGKYDKDAEDLLRKYPDSQTCIIVIGGPSPGFSIAAVDPNYLKDVPRVLRYLADFIDKSAAEVNWKVTKL